MDVGRLWRAHGAGCRVRFTCARCMRPRWSRSWAEAASASECGAGVAWFPLAPREVYVPWYRTSPGYVNNVNITNTRVNVTQVTNVYNTTIINNNTTNVTRINYVNQHVTNGVTAVSHETFVNARPVQANLAKVDQRADRECSRGPQHSGATGPAECMGAGRPVTVKPPADGDEPTSGRDPAASASTRVFWTGAHCRSRMCARRLRDNRKPRLVHLLRRHDPDNPRHDQLRQRGRSRPVQANQPPHPQEPANKRPAPPPNGARPGAAQPQEATRQPEPARPAPPSAPRPPCGTSSGKTGSAGAGESSAPAE